ncbi:MAG: right-handed parallel beta-helix repeat-containing protein [Bacteroidales bacterium]|nr:right-handed parallel beta-helix repeat-containing protein [Bacteroidales bacterium]
MKFKIITLLLLFAGMNLFGQTVIHNGQEVSGKWTKSGSPYIIEGEAIVPDGEKLTIKPGVEVQFKTGTDIDYRDYYGDRNPNFDVGFLRVNGTIIAKGKKNKMILFTSKDKYGKWGNVFMENSSDNIFEYCHVEKSQYLRSVTEDDNATGAISFIASSGIVKNCIIENSWSGINCKQKSMPEIQNCVIYNNEYGVEANSDSKPNVVNCIIWNNATCFYINPGASIKISYSLIQDDFKEEGLFDKGDNIYGKDPRLDGNFKLKDNSPCIKKGKDNSNMGIKF